MLSTLEKDSDVTLHGSAYATNDTWNTVSTSFEYISWTRGISAARAIGGTLNIAPQKYQPPLGAPYYRYMWSFTASTGDHYGDYIYQIL